ncbi:MAG: hypothetical protein COW18_09440 [Zetaproteobacteria bacterium CG12_big_fil_rev_8_21_14_0_65_54_13]|nr:MAG: hypothetical protein COX55_09800 [Zetaproteobacteria bacterium CG23_combo_of_CG06-09_8_20_14_all_54_7]PIW47124.1 MAG: hypothetical protein COW18_09440 [Zetaproteobacteria bacterium CG12_big_fil_rev_8_21_14_0_65_54_13]PIX55795.1 MAG: hypothetical protein COZ50_00680 [Zetaproteobacteria bacterium CG_4_10_14_3_um_filter_54_28]PJA29945.1 MAG: hypothetical protein CO188_05175 [Zetaproteobacteria bacterium CG_4_9_14_3_um_filter_54_145]
MFAHMTSGDIVLNLLFAIGMLQLAWISVILVRRGTPPAAIQHAILPPLAIWVLMWPVYSDSRSLWLGIMALILPAVLAAALSSPFWKHLRLAWRVKSPDMELKIYPGIQLPPLVHPILAMLIAAIWFRNIPEFGFGLALCLCLAFPAAYWMDQLGAYLPRFIRLGFPAHPEQTLAGHLLFIIISIVLLCWSLHVYHGTDWQALFIATLVTALTASATRALIPGQWHAPAAMLSMGFVMWVL